MTKQEFESALHYAEYLTVGEKVDLIMELLENGDVSDQIWDYFYENADYAKIQEDIMNSRY